MFDIVQNKIQLSTEDLAIPPFKDFYNNAKDKQDALKKIEFIVWRYKWNSPYEAYPEKERTWRVAEAVFKDKDYKPDDAVKELAKKFQELQETPATRLLKSSKSAAEGIMKKMDRYAEEEIDIDTDKKV